MGTSPHADRRKVVHSSRIEGPGALASVNERSPAGYRRHRDEVEGVVVVGPKFAVREDSVNKHASNLETSVSGLNAQASAFMSAIEPLRGQWQGTAFGSWQQLTSAWDSAMAELNRALGDIRGRVGSAGGLYDTYHQQQTEQLVSTLGSANWDGTKFRA
jgi:WXG100 family type VII secretion target